MIRLASLAPVLFLVAACGSSPSVAPSAAASVAPTSSTFLATPSAEAPPLPSASASAPASSPAPQTAKPTPSDPPARPSGVAFDLPDTPVTAEINQTYNTTGDPFHPADIGGLRPGAVTARWYVSDDRYVVHFEGLDVEATGPLCPGTSAQTAAGFEHVSNAPTAPGGCEGFDATLAAGPVGVRRCDDEVLYLTAIPADTAGVLFASIETQYETPGSVVGLTSAADPADVDAPPIDLDDPACEVIPARP